MDDDLFRGMNGLARSPGAGGTRGRHSLVRMEFPKADHINET
jgi:hypothetical protein